MPKQPKGETRTSVRFKGGFSRPDVEEYTSEGSDWPIAGDTHQRALRQALVDRGVTKRGADDIVREFSWRMVIEDGGSAGHRVRIRERDGLALWAAIDDPIGTLATHLARGAGSDQMSPPQAMQEVESQRRKRVEAALEARRRSDYSI